MRVRLSLYSKFYIWNSLCIGSRMGRKWILPALSAYIWIRNKTARQEGKNDDLRSQTERGHKYKGLQTPGFRRRCGFWYENGMHDRFDRSGARMHLRFSGEGKGVYHSLLRYLPGRKWYYPGGCEGKECRGKGKVLNDCLPVTGDHWQAVVL